MHCIHTPRSAYRDPRPRPRSHRDRFLCTQKSRYAKSQNDTTYSTQYRKTKTLTQSLYRICETRQNCPKTSRLPRQNKHHHSQEEINRRILQLQ